VLRKDDEQERRKVDAKWPWPMERLEPMNSDAEGVAVGQQDYAVDRRAWVWIFVEVFGLTERYTRAGCLEAGRDDEKDVN